MREVFRCLDDREKRALSRLLAAFVLGLAFFLIVSLGEKRSYGRALLSLEKERKAFEQVAKEHGLSKTEWDRMEEARQDFIDLKTTWFYEDQAGIRPLRLHLQQIFSEAGLGMPEVAYEYQDLKEENVRKVAVTFQFSISYPALREFLSLIEKFPKFLMVERIDFRKVAGQGNIIELRVVMAGYYAG